MKPKSFLKQNLVIVAVAIIVSFLAACTQQVSDVIPRISPPIPEFDPAFTEFAFNAETGDTLILKSGTSILVPPMALVNSTGNPIKGEVKMQYREFHNAADILLAGVPMQYDSAGTHNYLQTAGMFEMYATQANAPVFIKDGANINVSMASFETGKDFNFYRFEKDSGNWNYLGTSEPVVNTYIDTIKERIKKLTPEYVIPFEKDHFIMNYTALLDVFYRDNWQKVANNKNNPEPGNKAKAYGLEWHDIYSGNDINFRGVWYPATFMVWKNLSGKEIPKWTNEGWITELKKLGNNQYMLVIQTRSDKKYSLKAEAIMPLKALLAFPPEHWKEQYAEILAQLDEENERLLQQAEIFRNFQVNDFGVYNWDKIYKNERAVSLAGNFDFKEQVNTELADIQLFYIFANNKSVIRFEYGNTDNITLAPDSTAKILAVLPGKKIAMYNSDRYTKINFDSLKPIEKPKYDFTMLSSATVSTPEDVMKLVGVEIK